VGICNIENSGREEKMNLCAFIHAAQAKIDSHGSQLQPPCVKSTSFPLSIPFSTPHALHDICLLCFTSQWTLHAWSVTREGRATMQPSVNKSCLRSNTSTGARHSFSTPEGGLEEGLTIDHFS
jgi:hypothetical protein